MKQALARLVAPLALALAAFPAAAEKIYAPGISDSEIKIGQTLPLSGPVSAYGQIGRAEAGLFPHDQRPGRRQWPRHRSHRAR